MKQTKADKKAIRFARKHLDLSKDLNAQAYYGPFPNDADPRAITHGESESEKEYYTWIDGWIRGHGSIDNKKMYKDRMRMILEENVGKFTVIE